MLNLLLFLLPLPEPGNLHLDLLHAVLVELFPVTEEEEDLQDDEERGRDEGLVPWVQEGGSPALEDSVTDELSDPHDQVEHQHRLEEGIALHWSSDSHKI